MNKIFISYSRPDKDFVERLARDISLRLPSGEIFYDMLVKPGASWVGALTEAIQNADVILAVLSPDYLKSAWAQQEINVALEAQLEKRARVVPLMVRPCRPPGFLAALTWVDFTQDYQAALEQLMWGITGERPMAVRGEEPGTPNRDIAPAELEALRRELREAVEMLTSAPVVADRLATRTKRTAGDKRRCFVVMPFGDPDLQDVYEYFVKPTLIDGCNLLCERGDDVFGSNVIMDDIIKSIRASDVVLADLTRKNANVFYEIGICHALSKPVLLLAQSVEDVPFDLRHRRVLLYDFSPAGCKRLEGTLKQNMQAVLSEA